MGWRKTSLVVAGVLVALLACGALTLHFLVDADRVKSAVADRARTQWERDLLMGDVTLRLLPLPSLRASKVTFSNPKWAKEPHLLQAEHVRADLDFLPLLTGKVRIRSLSLEGVKAGLEVADDGKVSWDLARAGAQPEKPAKEKAEDDGAFEINAIHITDARIVHREGRQDGEPWHIEEAVVERGPGPSGATIDAKVTRHGQRMQVKASLADISHLGEKGAASDGKVELAWGEAKVLATGRFPLHRALEKQDMKVAVEAPSLQPVFAFFGVKRGKTAPLKAGFVARDEGGKVQLKDIDARLGALVVKGSAIVTREPKLQIHAKLAADRLDWLRTLQDAGGTIKPPRKDGEVFHEDPVAWRAVTSVGALDGTADLDIASLRLGNGLELRKVQTKVRFGDGRMEMVPFAADLLGGSAKGALRFDGRKKVARFELDGSGLLLERWFLERGSKVPFKGGPMTVKADLTLGGDTYRDLASSVSGRFTAHMGKGVWKSARAGEWEELMVRLLKPKDNADVEFHCAAADLRFKAGRASGSNIVAARSDVSQLITSGHVDFREETIDLRGKVISRSGPRVGLGSFASEVQITGKLAKPTMQLDPDAKPQLLARAGAAVATAGVSLLGSALVDVAESQNDPCKEVVDRKQ